MLIDVGRVDCSEFDNGLTNLLKDKILIESAKGLRIKYEVFYCYCFDWKRLFLDLKVKYSDTESEIMELVVDVLKRFKVKWVNKDSIRTAFLKHKEGLK